MRLKFLTLTLILTNALISEDGFCDLKEPVKVELTPYNVYHYTRKLNLQICVFVGIGLKYYAIFVEDQTEDIHGANRTNNYFLGICHLSTLEEWKLCSPELFQKRKRKCRLNLSRNKHHARVHRRFCDFNVLISNKDCQCIPTLFGNDMRKVIGLPTCYIPPLPTSLCKYNVCGLSQCKTSTTASKIHSVHCNCEAPFCENSTILGTSVVPVITSSWTPWKQEVQNENSEILRESENLVWKRQKALCVDIYTGIDAVDCLGPGTTCCIEFANSTNCFCRSYMKNSVLTLERTLNVVRRNKSMGLSDIIHEYDNEMGGYYSSKNIGRRRFRYTRELTNKDDEDIEDDDPNDENDEADEDIVLEETEIKDDDPVNATEEPDKEDLENQLREHKMTGKSENINYKDADKNCASICSFKSNYFVFGLHIYFIAICFK